MNDRIKEIANQCTTKYLNGFGGHTLHFNEEKFAELIAVEILHEFCIQLDIHQVDQINNPAFYKALQATELKFGVKNEYQKQ